MIYCPVCADDREKPHTHCPSCNMQGAFCSHHASDQADQWALSNRIMCDFFHRGIVPPRLPVAERGEFWETASDAAAWAG